jgi:hypothetical protein
LYSLLRQVRVNRLLFDRRDLPARRSPLAHGCTVYGQTDVKSLTRGAFGPIERVRGLRTNGTLSRETLVAQLLLASCEGERVQSTLPLRIASLLSLPGSIFFCDCRKYPLTLSKGKKLNKVRYFFARVEPSQNPRRTLAKFDPLSVHVRPPRITASHFPRRTTCASPRLSLCCRASVPIVDAFPPSVARGAQP